MDYTTLADLEGRLKRYYAQLYKDSETGEVDEQTATDDLTDAEAEVNASVAVRYSVPVTAATALPMLRSWTLTLAEELAWRHSAQGKTPDNVVTRVEAVRDALKALATGDKALPGAAESATSAGGAAFVQCNTPEFTREKMEGF